MFTWILKISKGRDSTTSPGNLCKVFPDIKLEFCRFNLSMPPLALTLATTEKSLALSSSCPPFSYLLDVQIPMSPFFFRLNGPNLRVPTFSASPQRGGAPVSWSFWCPYIVLFSVYLRLSCTGASRTGHSTPGEALLVLSRGEGWALLTCWWYYV